MSRQLPSSPNSKLLRKQAKELIKAYADNESEARRRVRSHHPRSMEITDLTLQDAQLVIAREYGYDSWPALIQAIRKDGTVTDQIEQAIETDDSDEVKRLITSHPELVNTSINWNGYTLLPASFAARRHSPNALTVLIDAGAELNDPNFNPYAFTTLDIMKALYANGAVVERKAPGYHPVQAACEALLPDHLKWLIDHGANPNNADHPLALVTHNYGSRNEQQRACLDILIEGGIHYEDTPVIDMHRGRLDLVEQRLRDDPDLANAHFSNVPADVYPDGGSWGGALLRGTTLLHACAEYGEVDCARLALRYGADVNARARRDGEGYGDQTPIFHAVTAFDNISFSILKWLIENGADVNASASLRVPPFWFDEERGDVLMDHVTPLGYTLGYPNYEYRIEYRRPDTPDQRIIDLLERHGAEA